MIKINKDRIITTQTDEGDVYVTVEGDESCFRGMEPALSLEWNQFGDSSGKKV